MQPERAGLQGLLTGHKPLSPDVVDGVTRRGRDRTAWPWAVLLLIVGVLAMHGLVSTGHAAHRSSTSMSMAAAADVLAMPPASAHDVPAALAKSGDAGLPEVVVGAVGLCLVVLLGVLLLPRARRGWSVSQPFRLTTATAVRTTPPGRGPPRLLLAQLCVLRT